MVMLPVQRWRVSSTVSNDDGLCPSIVLINLWLGHTVCHPSPFWPVTLPCSLYGESLYSPLFAEVVRELAGLAPAAVVIVVDHEHLVRTALRLAGAFPAGPPVPPNVRVPRIETKMFVFVSSQIFRFRIIVVNEISLQVPFSEKFCLKYFDTTL